MKLTVICPHCARETDAYQQRCSQCGVTRISDRAFRWWQTSVQPLVEEIETIISEGGDSTIPVKQAKQLDHLTEDWDELRHWYDRYAAHMPRERGPSTARLRQMRQINWAILIFFALVAALAGAYTRDVWLAALLTLPVIGWYWLGIHSLRS